MDDPEAWAREYLGREHEPEEHLIKTVLDLDDDGDLDLLFATTAESGNAGMFQYAFRNTPAGYEPLGEIFAHPRAVIPLPPGRNGEVRAVTYWRNGAADGDIIWWISRDGRFEEERRERIHFGEDGVNRRYDDIFGRSK